MPKRTYYDVHRQHSLYVTSQDWRIAGMRKVDAVVLLGQALSGLDVASVAFRELGFPQAKGHELETFLYMLKKEMSSPNQALTTSLIELVTRRGEGVYTPDQFLFNRRVVWDSFMFDAVGGKNGPVLLHARTSSALTLKNSAGGVVTYRGCEALRAELIGRIRKAYEPDEKDPKAKARLAITELYRR